MAYFRCTTSGSGTGATITVSYESEVYGQTLTCTDGTHTYTKTAASTGSTVFTVPNGGTWTISVVMYGHTYSQQVIVVSEYTCTLELWSATVNISTTATELYSQTITVKKGGSTIGSTAFDSSGSATYIAPEEGTYTFECTYSGQTYSASVNVTEETTYSVVISMGLELSNWLTAGGLDPSDYADLSEVLADEEAVRRLMTIHDSVDYLATASAGDQMVSTIISDNTGAKWINLRDYAFDVLSANSDIKSMMDTADKYGYGEWVVTDNTTTPPTWGAKGNVPIMTSNSAPYGTASAYQVFDGNPSTTASGTDFSYKFTNPVCVKDFICKTTAWVDIEGGTLQASNDGTTWDVPTAGAFYLYYRVHFASSQTVGTVQFYGREMKVSVPAMTSNTQPWGEASVSSQYNSYAAWEAFDGTIGANWSANNFWVTASNATNNYIKYNFDKPILMKKMIAWFNSTGGGKSLSDGDIVLQASNDDTNWTDLYSYGAININQDLQVITIDLDDNETMYSIYRLFIKPLIFTLAGNAITITELNFFGFDYSERDWDTDHPMRYLYDHGISFEELHDSAGTHTEGSYYLNVGATSQVSTRTQDKIDLTDYSLVRLVSEDAITYPGEPTLFVLTADSWSAVSAYTLITTAMLPRGIGLGISSVADEEYVNAANSTQSSSFGDFRITEWWLE